jgi:hypothetical protein
MCVVIANLVHDIITAGIALGGVYLGGVLAEKRDYRIACGNFRAAFSDLLSTIHDGTATPAIVKATSRGHEEAILRFQAYVPWWKSKGFDAAYKTYHEQRLLAQAEASLKNITPNEYSGFLKSIEGLLSYAK